MITNGSLDPQGGRADPKLHREPLDCVFGQFPKIDPRLEWVIFAYRPFLRVAFFQIPWTGAVNLAYAKRDIVLVAPDVAWSFLRDVWSSAVYAAEEMNAIDLDVMEYVALCWMVYYGNSVMLCYHRLHHGDVVSHLFVACRVHLQLKMVVVLFTLLGAPQDVEPRFIASFRCSAFKRFLVCEVRGVLDALCGGLEFFDSGGGRWNELHETPLSSRGEFGAHFRESREQKGV